jgi:glutamate racemase
MDKKMDAVLLACTHYPIIQEQLQAISIDKIQLVSQGQIVARSLKDYLSRHKNIDAKLLKNGVTTYLTTENPEIFNRNALQFVGSPILALHTQIDTIQ